VQHVVGSVARADPQLALDVEVLQMKYDVLLTQLKIAHYEATNGATRPQAPVQTEVIALEELAKEEVQAREAIKREQADTATNLKEAQPAPNQREAAEAVQAAAARKRESAVAAAVQEREAADAVLEREDPIGQVPVLGLNLAAGGAGTRPGDSSGPEVRHEGTADLKFVLGDPVRLEELSSDAIGRQVAVKWLAPDRKGSTWHQGTVQAYHAQTLRVKYEDGYEDDVAIQTEEVVWATERPATAAKEILRRGRWRRLRRLKRSGRRSTTARVRPLKCRTRLQGSSSAAKDRQSKSLSEPREPESWYSRCVLCFLLRKVIGL
jgi:hypothetical protein